MNAKIAKLIRKHVSLRGNPRFFKINLAEQRRKWKRLTPEEKEQARRQMEEEIAYFKERQPKAKTNELPAVKHETAGEVIPATAG